MRLAGSSIGFGVSAAGESTTIASSSVTGVEVALGGALLFFLGGMFASSVVEVASPSDLSVRGSFRGRHEAAAACILIASCRRRRDLNVINHGRRRRNRSWTGLRDTGSMGSFEVAGKCRRRL